MYIYISHRHIYIYISAVIALKISPLMLLLLLLLYRNTAAISSLKNIIIFHVHVIHILFVMSELSKSYTGCKIRFARNTYTFYMYYKTHPSPTNTSFVYYVTASFHKCAMSQVTELSICITYL